LRLYILPILNDENIVTVATDDKVATKNFITELILYKEKLNYILTEFEHKQIKAKLQLLKDGGYKLESVKLVDNSCFISNKLVLEEIE
jgi:hypothetical protein